jgi:uncharacterized protein
MYLTRRIACFEVAPKKYLMANAITGEIVVINDSGVLLLNSLAAGRVPPCHENLVEELKAKRLLFSSKEEEERFFEEICNRAWADVKQNAPRHYMFIVNSHCNFNCPYCFERPGYRSSVTSLSRQQIDAAFRVVDAYSARKNKPQPPDIEVFGGEPLLPHSRPEVEYLISTAATRGILCSVQTNGYYLSSFVDFLAEHSSYVRQIQVTLDGPQPIHDQRRAPRSGHSFDRIVRAIEDLRDRALPIRISIRMNVDSDNVQYLPAMMNYYRQRGWDADDKIRFIAAPVDNRCGSLTGNAKLLGWKRLFECVLPLSSDRSTGLYDLSIFKALGYFREYFATIAGQQGEKPEFVPKVLYCEAAASKLMAFHPDGRIYPCPEAIGTQHLAIGSYFPEFRLDRKKARPWRQQTIMNRPQCAGCSISTFCGGGCILTALMHNGDMSVPDCEEAPEILKMYFAQTQATV